MPDDPTIDPLRGPDEPLPDERRAGIDLCKHGRAVCADPDCAWTHEEDDDPEDYDLPGDERNRPDASGTDAPPAYVEDEPRVIHLNDLNAALLTALGLDPAQCAGARLTIMGGAYPQLEEFKLVPHTADGNFLDTWVSPLSRAMADRYHVVLPGAEADAAPATPYDGIPEEVAARMPVEMAPDVWVVRHLRQLLDAVNGSPLSAADRDALTSAGHAVWQELDQRMYRWVMDQITVIRDNLPPTPTDS